MMPDDILESLGEYFVKLDIAARYGITFARFVEMWKSDTWKDVVAC